MFYERPSHRQTHFPACDHIISDCTDVLLELDSDRGNFQRHSDQSGLRSGTKTCLHLAATDDRNCQFAGARGWCLGWVLHHPINTPIVRATQWDDAGPAQLCVHVSDFLDGGQRGHLSGFSAPTAAVDFSSNVGAGIPGVPDDNLGDGSCRWISKYFSNLARTGDYIFQPVDSAHIFHDNVACA